MTAARNYSSVASLATLTAGITDSQTSIAVNVTTGFPIAPFTLVIDPGLAAEEIITVTSLVGLAVNCLRGQDGSAAQPHSAGAQVRHMATARDFREPAEHIALTSGVHGVTGDLAGTTMVQAMDNKTFQSTGSDHSPLKVQGASGQTVALVDFLSLAASSLSRIDIAGRFVGPGIISQSTSTFAPLNASTVALVASGAVSQTAAILSVRDSTATEVLGVYAAGLVAKLITAAQLIVTSLSSSNVPIVAKGAVGQTASLFEARDTTDATKLAVTSAGRVTSPGIDSSVNSTFTATGATSPVVITAATAGTGSALSVIDQASGLERAGVKPVGGSYQLFHGGASTNLLPFKIHGGTVADTILNGAFSTGGSIDISSFGFTVTPVIILTVGQPEESTIAHRAAINIRTLNTSNTTIGYRIFPSAGEAVPSLSNFTIHWVAIQFLPGSAAG
jgi:hypothetical protein